MIGLTGTNFRTSPLDIREKLAFTNEECIAFMQHLLGVTSINGMVLLSTCNRTELYFHIQEEDPNVLALVRKEMLRFKEVEHLFTPGNFYIQSGDEAVSHLFRVASGLDSMVLGEYQILGQVKDFFRLSNENDCTSPIINRLFHKAFEAGKKIRNLYTIKSVPLSAGSAAVSMVCNGIKEISTAKVLIVGAGQMAETVILSLRKKGFTQIEICNRTEDRARRLAERYQSEVCLQENMMAAIGQADLVFAATGAINPVITSDIVRLTKPVTMFDLSVPRNIDPKVGSIAGVTLYGIDHLQNQLAEDDSLTINLSLANDMISTIVAEFNNWLSALNLTPVIELLESRFDQVLNQRLDHLRTRLTVQEFELVERNGKYLRDKYLRNIIVSLRELSENGRKPDYVEMMNRMLEYKR